MQHHHELSGHQSWFCMTPILGVTCPRKGATKNLTGIVLVCVVVAICVVFCGGGIFKFPRPSAKHECSAQALHFFVATDAIGWLRSQDGQQNKELQQEKRPWLIRFNSDRCKRPMASSKNCQAKSDARRKALCNTLATNMFFITSRKNMSRKTCGGSS